MNTGRYRKALLAALAGIMASLAGCAAPQVQNQVWEYSQAGALRKVAQRDLTGFQADWMERLAPHESYDEVFLIQTDYPGGGAGEATEILLRNGQGEVRWLEGYGYGYRTDRYFFRALTAPEIAAWRSMINDRKIDDLRCSPFGGFDGVEYHYLHWKRGEPTRDLRLNNPHEDDPVIADLLKEMETLTSPETLRVHYQIRTLDPRVTLLYARAQQEVRRVWARGDDVRVLVGVPEMIGGQWWRLKDGRLVEKVDEPPELPKRPGERLEMPARELGVPNAEDYQTTFALPVGDGYLWKCSEESLKDEVGTWLSTKGRKPERLFPDTMTDDIVTSDNQYLLGLVDKQVKCFDLRKRLWIPIHDPDELIGYTVYDELAARRQVLLVRATVDSAGPPGTHFEFRLLDPTVGTSVPIELDYWAVQARPYRCAMQETSKPGVYWLSLADKTWNDTQIIRFDTNNLRLHGLNSFVIPGVTFNGEQMWVDETTQKLYFTYDGQLFRIPVDKRVYKDDD